MDITAMIMGSLARQDSMFDLLVHKGLATRKEMGDVARTAIQRLEAPPQTDIRKLGADFVRSHYSQALAAKD